MSRRARGIRLPGAPAWVGEVTGAPARQVRVGGREDALVYDITVGRQRSRVIVPVERSGRAFAWAAVSLRVPSAPPRLLASVAARDDFRQDVHRHAWLVNAFSRGLLPTDHVPTPVERGLMESMPAFSDKSLPLTLPADRGPSDAYLDALRTYVAAVQGDWPRVFSPATIQRGASSPWLAPVLALLGGDVVWMQELAAMDVEALRGRPVANIAATVFKEKGFLDVAVDLTRTSVEHLEPHEQADILLGFGQLLGRMERREEARDVLRRAVLLSDEEPRFLRRAAAELVRIGDLDDAYGVLERCQDAHPDDVEVTLDFVSLLLFSGEWDRALRLLDGVEARAGGRPELARYRGAIAVEQRELDRAIEILSAHAAAVPDDREARTWLCEALIRAGQPELAEEHHNEARAEHDSAIHILLRGAMDEPEGLHEDRELGALLDELGAPFGDRPTEARREHVLDTLATFRGRGEVLTRVDPDHTGPTAVKILKLSRMESRLSSRIESANAVKDVVRIPLDRVFATFDDILARYPESPHPHCYRGEVKLWLGDYDGAMADFDAAMERNVARWAFVGRAAVHLLRGERGPALEQIERCHRVFTPVPSATTTIYLGEMYRREGDLEQAAQYLDESVRVKPGRLSAWMNLALVHAAAGRESEAREVFSRVASWAPRLLWDARASLRADGGREVSWPPRYEDMSPLFETSLSMMRGNRSSHCVTYFDPDGVFRQVHDAAHWQSLLSRMRVFVWAETRRRLIAGA